ncbi:MAG: nitroreductase family protein [Spirochaetales bacterium]|nr:nitroreductase family protein [Spirochaetales bacterium]
MAILDLIKNRVSSKSFIDKEIDEIILNNILEAGRLAPSAKNRQPWRFISISDPGVKKILLDACFGAETIKTADKIIAVCTTNINYNMPNGQPAHVFDLSVATAFMMMQAEHEGVGSCIVTTYNEELIRELLTVPFSMRVFSLLALGYTAVDKSNEIFKERKSLKDVHNKEHW